MKTTGALLSTLVALSCGSAMAQSKFDVKIGGDFYVEGGYVSQSNQAGLRSTELRNRFRLNITPSATADNGLHYGARVRLRANNGSRDVDSDRAYLFAQGSFGQVRLGANASFSDDTWVGRPIDFLPLNGDDGLLGWFGSANTTGRNGATFTTGNAINAVGGTLMNQSLTPESNATKIVYYSPRLAGLQVGGSYTPRSDSANGDINRVKPTAGTSFAGVFTDMVELGANYKERFGSVSVKAGLGYFHGRAPNGSTAAVSYKDLNAWQAGLQIGYAGFAVGGAIVDYGQSGQNRRAPFTHDASLWTVGAQYTTGPWVAGIGFNRSIDPGSIGTQGVARVGQGVRRVNIYQGGAGYTVAPGFQLQAEYDYFDYRGETSTQTDHGHVVLARSVLAF